MIRQIYSTNELVSPNNQKFSLLERLVKMVEINFPRYIAFLWFEKQMFDCKRQEMRELDADKNDF